MAGRPIKKTADYFLHDTIQRKTIFILKSKYGNDGYATWFQLLEVLGHTEGHCYDCNSPDSQEYISAYMLLTWGRFSEIMDTLSNLKAIDPTLWKKKIIWSSNFVNRLSEMYRRRHSSVPEPPNIKQKKEIKESALPEDSVERQLAEYLIEQINGWGFEWPHNKQPDPQAWAGEFDKLIRIDKRPPERIREVIEWVENNSCAAEPGSRWTGWRTVIRSPANLRDKWDKITAQMNNGNGKTGAGAPVANYRQCPHCQNVIHKKDKICLKCKKEVQPA